MSTSGLKIFGFILLAVVGLLVFLYFKFIKRLELDSLTLVTGGVKCGKTTLSVWLSTNEYLKRLKKWEKREKFCKFLHLKNKTEKPLFYSNVPVYMKHKVHGKYVEVGYSPITLDLLTRKKRFNFGSVVYFCESSLIADSTDTKNLDLNTNMNLLFKLCSHETHGGKFYFDTQSISDNHYTIKRNLARYIYCNKLIKNLPFILLFDVRERMYSYDSGIVGTNEEITDCRKYVIVPKKVWKRFDTFAYSGMTDNLPVSNDILYTNGNLKVNHITSFRGCKK